MSRLHGRPQPAPTTGTTQRVSGFVAPAPVLDGTRSEPARSTRRRPTMERRVLVVGGALLGGVLAAVVLAGSMSEAVTQRAIARDVSAANEVIAARVEAGRREIEFAQTPAFLEFAARSFGYGRARERPFALAEGAPPAPTIEPLGATQLLSPPRDALDSVLELLFER